MVLDVGYILFQNDKLTVLTSHKNRGKKAIVEAGNIT